jgi:hypothetical protein
MRQPCKFGGIAVTKKLSGGKILKEEETLCEGKI